MQKDDVSLTREEVDDAISNNADLLAQNEYGLSLVHRAAYVGHIEAIDRLLEAGIDINTRTSYGYSPLMIATLSGQSKTAAHLISKGADVSITNSRGVSAKDIARDFQWRYLGEMLQVAQKQAQSLIDQRFTSQRSAPEEAVLREYGYTTAIEIRSLAYPPTKTEQQSLGLDAKQSLRFAVGINETGDYALAVIRDRGDNQVRTDVPKALVDSMISGNLNLKDDAKLTLISDMNLAALEELLENPMVAIQEITPSQIRACLENQAQTSITIEEPKVSVQFEGIDSWGRPVFCQENGSDRYAALDILFHPGDSKETVLQSVTPKDLSYYGRSFDREPVGGPAEGVVFTTSPDRSPENSYIKDFTTQYLSDHHQITDQMLTHPQADRLNHAGFSEALVRHLDGKQPREVENQRLGQVFMSRVFQQEISQLIVQNNELCTSLYPGVAQDQSMQTMKDIAQLDLGR
jgi:hypothetical protein